MSCDKSVADVIDRLVEKWLPIPARYEPVKLTPRPLEKRGQWPPQLPMMVDPPLVRPYMRSVPAFLDQEQ